MTLQFKHISFDTADGISTIVLNHPPVNVLTIEMIGEINYALAELSTNRTARVLLFRGNGKCFSAGVDVAEHLPETVEKMLLVMQRLFEHLSGLEIPSVSAVHGCALGGGLELAAFTDLTLVSASAELGLPEMKLGVFPPLAVAHFSKLIGSKRAHDLILTGRKIGAKEALRIGLASAVFSDTEFVSKVNEVVASLSGYSRSAMAAAKKALQQAEGLTLFHALAAAQRIYLDDLMASEDAVEGLTAFLEKRPPRWKNN